MHAPGRDATQWGRLAAPVFLVSALVCAPVGCKDRPAATPGPASEGHGVPLREPSVAKMMEESRNRADVVFDGIVKSIDYAHTEHGDQGITVFGPPGMVLAAIDPYFLVTVQVEKVLKGDAAAWSGEKVIAIHSVVRDLGISREEAPGKRLRFYLDGQKQDGIETGRFLGLSAMPVGAGQ